MFQTNIDSIKNSFYYNLIAPREEFVHYHRTMRDKAIKIEQTKNGLGPLAVAQEQFFSNPAVQESMKKYASGPLFYSTFAHRVTYEQTYSYCFISSIRDLIKSVFSNIFPDLKKY